MSVKTTSVCLVSARDYKMYWGRDHASHDSQPIPWDLFERRTGVDDRRATGHDRRYDAGRGRRRYAIPDDRRTKQK